MSDKIEISLSRIHDVQVDLTSMGADALASFMGVVTSLKDIAEAVVGKDELRFSLLQGSAVFQLDAPPAKLEAIYREIDAAIQGESSNQAVTEGLRQIQNQVKRSELGYGFRYQQAARVFDMHSRLVEANRITVKRKATEFHLELKSLQGMIKQIGGDQPNYHLDAGNRQKYTVECTVEQAIGINRFLYQAVNVVAVAKSYADPGKKDKLHHLSMVSNELGELFNSFASQWNGHTDLIERLDYLHQFVDAQFSDPSRGFMVLNALLQVFNHPIFHLSEIKTLLVISKPFAARAEVQAARAALLETYHSKRS